MFIVVNFLEVLNGRFSAGICGIIFGLRMNAIQLFQQKMMYIHFLYDKLGKVFAYFLKKDCL